MYIQTSASHSSSPTRSVLVCLISRGNYTIQVRLNLYRGDHRKPSKIHYDLTKMSISWNVTLVWFFLLTSLVLFSEVRLGFVELVICLLCTMVNDH